MSKKKKSEGHVKPAIPPRMREKFNSAVTNDVMPTFGVTNKMAMPRLEKIVLSVGMGKQLSGTKLDARAKEEVLKTLGVITGQKPVIVKAKKSVSNFKVREGYETGAMVTIRGERMWEFFDRLVSLAIPRIKDFRGLKDTSFDANGNYSFGITEQGIFPEVDMTSAQFTHGMHITFVFKNSKPEWSKASLAKVGFPFVKPEDN